MEEMRVGEFPHVQPIVTQARRREGRSEKHEDLEMENKISSGCDSFTYASSRSRVTNGLAVVRFHSRRQRHRSNRKPGALILAFRPSFLFVFLSSPLLSSRGSLMVPDLFQDKSSGRSHFTFSNPKPHGGSDAGSGWDGSDYMAWAERIKGNPGGRSVGAWTRRSSATPLMSSPRYVRQHGWWSAEQAEDEGDGDGDGYGIPSPPLWKNFGNSPRRPGPTAMSQEIVRYRQEMLELVRGLPESEYELSLRDLVEDRGLLAEGKESQEGEEKSETKGKRSERKGSTATGGLLLGMRFPFSVGDRRKRLSASREKKSGLGGIGSSSTSSNSSTGSSSSNSSTTTATTITSNSRSRNKKTSNCHCFFQRNAAGDMD